MGLTTISVIFISGIIIFSIAEFIVHPTYLSYISKIAPRDKVAVYMGYGFIPAFIGYTSGNFLVALFYTVFAEEAHRPKFFWSIIGTVGLLTIASLMLYSQYLARRGVVEKSSSERESENGQEPAGMEERALPDVVSAQSGIPLRKHPVWESRVTVAVALLFIPGLLFGAYGSGTDIFYRDFDNGSHTPWEGYNVSEGRITLTGYSNENTDTQEQVVFDDQNIISATFNLTWTDEPDQGNAITALVNQPDEFGLSMTAPNGTTVESNTNANIHGQKGLVSLTMDIEPKKPQTNGNGTFEATVICANCGDLTGRFGVRSTADNGNAWTLEVNYAYYMKK